MRETVDTLQRKHSFSDSTKSRLIKVATRVPIQWNRRPAGIVFHSKEQSFSELDILQAWSRQKNCYISHLSAIYVHGLIEQRPKDFFISKEVSSKSKPSSRDAHLDEFAIRQAFLKKARTTSNFFEFETSKFFIIEKQNLNQAGVIEKGMKFESAKMIFKVTSIERTFLDCVVSPQYSGGIPTVANAFSKVILDIDKLLDLYKKMDPIYPYWQVIGFLLGKLGQSAAEKKWSTEFKSQEKIPFYIAHEAKNYWKFSDAWKVFYPNGVFIGADN